MNASSIRRPHAPRSFTVVVLAVMALSLASLAVQVHAQGSSTMLIYPAKGQSAKQQDKDQYECHDWARAQTGFDPTQTSAAAAGGQTNSSGASTGGIVKGAAGGAAVAELSHHDAGRGAAIGVLGAATLARAKEQQAAAARQQQATQQQAMRSQQRATYDRAIGACMEGRGYTVR